MELLISFEEIRIYVNFNCEHNSKSVFSHHDESQRH
jgi:hypothetical protein